MEETIRALREKLENSAADTLAQIENLRAEQDGNRREAESNIQALRNNLEQQRSNYEEKLDNERALHQAARREAETNIQALRDTMEKMRNDYEEKLDACLLYTSPSPRDGLLYRMPSSA